MRVRINFTFNDRAPSSPQYYVNIYWRDVAATNNVLEMTRRQKRYFQSGDKTRFSKFKVVATIFRMVNSNGKSANESNIGKNTHILIPTNISFRSRNILMKIEIILHTL